MVRTGHDVVASGHRSIRALDAVPAVETALFVACRAPGRGAVLEVGCGSGELALLLGRIGFRVTALDESVEAVQSTRDRGVDVRVARWPDFEGGPYDVVLFSRSLHHMHDLDAALAHAARLLAPTGVLLIEDFAREGMDLRTADWLRDAARRCRGAGLVAGDEGLVAEVLEAADAAAVVEAWRRRHGDDLHAAAAIDAAVRRRFRDVRASRGPYLYRYAAHALVRDRAGFLALREWLACEQAAALEGTIEPVGRRWVARPELD